ncbi:MAG: 6-carboxytetrahydropterin synthase QueD, partial [Syntrophales bacterium]
MPEVFEISVTTEFSAAHALEGYPGDCAQVHGHNWTVEVFVRCRELNAMGIGIDFREVKQAVRESIENLDHSYLNEHPSFTKLNPSSENIAKFLYKE